VPNIRDRIGVVAASQVYLKSKGHSPVYFRPYTAK